MGEIGAKPRNRIKILGAGISGLVAAILLVRNGFEVDVFEKRPGIGSHHTRDVNSLRNYYYESDALSTYRDIGISVSHTHPIGREVRFSPSLKRVEIVADDGPLFYNFLRGYGSLLSLDMQLFEMARGSGVSFYFNQTMCEEEANIVATGGRSAKGMVYGKHYEKVAGLDPNSVYLFLGNRYSPGAYSYVLPFKDEATVCVTSSRGVAREDLEDRFADLVGSNEIVRSIVKQAQFTNEVYGPVYYDLPATAVSNGRLYVGEAAGFFDAATGFGTHYAIISGYLAARAITENLDYDRLWKDAFGDEFRTRFLRRQQLQRFDDCHYEDEIGALIQKYGDRIPGSLYRRLRRSTYDRRRCG